MIIHEDFSLKNYNTFHFDVKSKYFAAPESSDQLADLLQNNIAKNEKILVLGGGSNILFTKDFDGLVIKPIIDNIKIIDSNDSTAWVEAGAGVEWDAFVAWAVDQNYAGVENLSLIPGNVGACPVQNIGAYGTEVKDIITHVNGVFLDSGESFSLKNKDCNFSYRNSIFKQELKDKTIITSVCFKLNKKHTFMLHYGDVKDMVDRLGGASLSNIRNAIISIRETKLPDHTIYGNVGSFFKNPVVSKSIANKIKDDYADAPVYDVSETHSKLAAGWMIDQCHWKGKSLKNAAVHENQALVLINKNGQGHRRRSS